MHCRTIYQNLVQLISILSLTFFIPFSAYAVIDKFQKTNMPPIENQVLAHDIFKRLVEIRSTHTAGTKKAAEVLANYFIKAGFAPKDVLMLPTDNYLNQVNLIVYLHGKKIGKPILWLAHLDVVDASSAGWSFPPFKLTEKNGYFYGRGTIDMKDQVSAVAASLIRLKQEGFIPDRDIIAAFTSDEEAGINENGAKFLFAKHRDLVDAQIVINPDGNSGEIINGKRKDFIIESSQKTYATYLLEVTNKGGHSSEPRLDNAIYTLANALIKLSRFVFPYKTNTTTRIYFQRMASISSWQERDDMLKISKENIDMAAAARLAKNVPFNALLHTTCVPTMLSAGFQENALPKTAIATIQCRIYPGESLAQTKDALLKAINDPSIKIKLISNAELGQESTPTPAILNSVQKVVHSMWPNPLVIPQMIPGATDSVYTRLAGIPSYGICGSWDDINDLRWHGNNERHEVKDFYTSVEFTYRLMKELSHK